MPLYNAFPCLVTVLYNDEIVIIVTIILFHLIEDWNKQLYIIYTVVRDFEFFPFYFFGVGWGWRKSTLLNGSMKNLIDKTMTPSIWYDCNEQLNSIVGIDWYSLSNYNTLRKVPYIATLVLLVVTSGLTCTHCNRPTVTVGAVVCNCLTNVARGEDNTSVFIYLITTFYLDLTP